MNARQLMASVVALGAMLTFGAAACGTESSHADTPKVGQQADARPELAAAARGITEQSFRLTLEKAGISGKGVADPRTRTGTMIVDFPKTGRQLFVTVFEDDVYFSELGVPGVSFKTSFRLPRSKVPAGSYLDVMPNDDPSGSHRLVDAVVSVRRDGGGPANGRHLFTGTIDLMATSYADENLRHEFGDKLKAVPFTAAVDDGGRLVEFVIALDTLAPKLGKVRAAWSDFGLQTNPKRQEPSQPTGDVHGLLQALES
ncbi:hypothetical protein GA0070613_1628 [Micromonospora inositola]|uniref:LppX_LprAFG lipoprotein n=2 Tax=Micromonospora inositola TaxID=47865 RepID=A0A1C5HPG1_9ACTN|nr:hypothetical protein GA0070613_1628 [Micromonospora inositola]